MEPIKKVLTISEIMHRKQMLSNKKDITEWCSRMQILQYTIQDDLSLVVYGDVDLSNKILDYLPVKFLETKGNFDCSNNKLTSLENCPVIVGAIFDCSDNKLISLEHSPKQVKSDFNCSDNKITSLQYITPVIGGDLDCSTNPITSLEYCPSIGYSLLCYRCAITSFKGFPSIIKGDLNCCANQFTNLIDAPKRINRHFYCDNNPITSFEKFPEFIGGKFHFGNLKVLDFKSFRFQIGEEVVHYADKTKDYLDGFEKFYRWDRDCSTFSLSPAQINSISLTNKLTEEFKTSSVEALHNSKPEIKKKKI